MEDYEKFKLNKSNIIMIIITCILLIVLMVVSVLLIISINKPTDGLPKLNITQGRYTTRETTATTASTTTTTTKKIVNESPYYDLNVDTLLSDDLYKKRDGLTRDEALTIGKDMFKFITSLYDITDYSIFDLGSIKNNVKEGESDLITKDGVQYGQLYNFDKVMDRFFIKQSRNNIFNYIYKDKYVIIKDNDKYYRMLNNVGNSELKIVDVELDSYTSYQIIMKYRYYNTNYKDLGYSSPNYSTASFTLKYEEGWKVSQFNYPLYK
jgi:hypothetical protein